MEVEQARILSNMSSSKIEGEEDELAMAKAFATSFRKVSKQNVDLLVSSIDRIETPENVIFEKEMITEFMDNIPADVVKKINETVNNVSPNISDIATFEFTCEACDHTEEVTFDMNPVNFSSAG